MRRVWSTNEIPVDGLATLAEVYATGILFVAVEVFLIARVPRVRLRRGLYSRASGGAVAALALPAFAALPVIVTSVIDDEPLGGVIGGMVRLAGGALWLGALALLVELAFMARQGDTDGAPGRAASGPMSGPHPDKPGSSKKRRRKRGH